MLVGPIERIRQVASQNQLSLDDVELVDVAHSHAAAQVVARLAAYGGVTTPRRQQA